MYLIRDNDIILKIGKQKVYCSILEEQWYTQIKIGWYVFNGA